MTKGEAIRRLNEYYDIAGQALERLTRVPGQDAHTAIDTEHPLQVAAKQQMDAIPQLGRLATSRRAWGLVCMVLDIEERAKQMDPMFHHLLRKYETAQDRETKEDVGRTLAHEKRRQNREALKREVLEWNAKLPPSWTRYRRARRLRGKVAETYPKRKAPDVETIATWLPEPKQVSPVVGANRRIKR
jgi:hypothetical protein